MRILGIDPGLATIGLGLITATSAYDMEAVEWLTLTTKAGVPIPERLLEIHQDLSAYLREAKPELAVVERLFFAHNETTAFDVSQARGIILLTLAEAGIPLLEPSPLQLKSAVTGAGKASKNQMRDMVVRLFRLSTPPTPDDAADALALAAFGAINVVQREKMFA